MNTLPIFSLVVYLAASLLLSSCAHQRLPQNENWNQHSQKLSQLKQWQAFGKLAVKLPNDGGSMSLRWQQQADEFSLDFSGPFGQNLLRIAGNSQAVTLSEPNHPPLSAKTAEELIKRNTGWIIPVTQLAYWVRGLPDPHSKITQFLPNPQGLLANLEQSGWQITYSEYTSLERGTDTLSLPKRIVAEFKDIRLTLVIREWQLDTTP